MESTEFPIVLKKRNGVMIGVSIIEIVTGLILGLSVDGIISAPLWIFVFAGIVTALSVWTEYSQDIYLKENKIEFYKNNDLIRSIKYSRIKSISIEKGNEAKTKKKDFVAISYNENDDKKNRNTKSDIYLINPMNYSSKDLTIIKRIILMKNSSIKVGENLDEFIK